MFFLVLLYMKVEGLRVGDVYADFWAGISGLIYLLCLYICVESKV